MNSRNGARNVTLAVLAGGWLLGLPLSARAGDGTWTYDGSDNWSSANRWSGNAVADGTDSTASFTGFNITNDRTVTVDVARTIGHLRFGDTAVSGYGQLWILSGATITLDVSGGQPTIRANTDVAGTGSATINVVLDGNDGCLFDQGTITLNQANIYTGISTLRTGSTVVVGNNQSFGSGALSLQGGTLWAATDRTLANDISLDGDFRFGYSGGSSYPGDLTFSKSLLLKGNFALLHNGTANDVRNVTFNAGVGDNGMGYDLTIKNGAYNNEGFFLNSGSTYTGATIVHGSTLRLIGALTTTREARVNRGGNLQAHGLRDAAGFSNNRFGDAIPVLLRGGTLSIYASYGSLKDQDRETFGTVTLDYGHSSIVAGGGRAVTRLSVTNLLRNASSTAYFYRYGEMATGAGGRITITNQAAGFVGGWAIARGADYPNTTEYDFAWYDTAAGVVAMASNATRPAQTEGATSADHVRAAAAQNTLTADTAINSLSVTNGCDQDLGGHTLDIVSGGLLNRGGSYTISNGTLTSSGGALFLYNLGTALTSGAAITGGGVSVTTVGDQTLNGNNSFGGRLCVNSGTLTLGGANTGAAEATVAPGALLRLGVATALPAALKLNLLFDGEEYGRVTNSFPSVVVRGLTLAGVKQAPGTYGATGSGCQFTNNNYFAGTGSLKVSQPSGTMVCFR